jgi:hypothetical protein
MAAAVMKINNIVICNGSGGSAKTLAKAAAAAKYVKRLPATPPANINKSAWHCENWRQRETRQRKAGENWQRGGSVWQR